MKDFLKRVLPWIGAAASGNVPALINLGAQEIGRIVGKDVKPDVESMAAAVAGATPEQIAAMREADNKFRLQMQALGFEHERELEKIGADDRASARAREMAVKDRVPAILAFSITAGFFGILAWILYGGLPNDGRDALLLMLGSLGSAWMGVVGYYFGSSAGSAKKDELMARAEVRK